MIILFTNYIYILLSQGRYTCKKPCLTWSEIERPMCLSKNEWDPMLDTIIKHTEHAMQTSSLGGVIQSLRDEMQSLRDELLSSREQMRVMSEVHMEQFRVLSEENPNLKTRIAELLRVQ